VRSMPTIGVAGLVWQRHVNGIAWVPFLDYIDYDKERCIDVLVKELGYRPYPYKHYESIFTRFYQGYLLPQKFGVDKRRLHFSSLICSGQMTRDEAVALLRQSPYPDAGDLETDIVYFLKKMGWTQADLDAYLRRPARAHDSYPSETGRYALLLGWLQRLRALRAALRTNPFRTARQIPAPPRAGRSPRTRC